MSAGASSKSTTPAAMALAGMPSNSLDDGDCAITRPPDSLMARAPRVPSDPVPESTMPTACWCWSRGQRAEEEIDRQPVPTRLARLGKADGAIDQGDVAIGRRHVGVVGLQRRAVFRLHHPEGRVPLHELTQEALVVGRQVLHEHERHSWRNVGLEA